MINKFIDFQKFIINNQAQIKSKSEMLNKLHNIRCLNFIELIFIILK